MLHIVAAWIFRTLHSDKVFVFTGASLQQEPVDGRITLVLVAFDKVPSQHEMLGNVVDTVTHQTHGHVVPGHPTELGFADFVGLPIAHTLEVHDPVIVEFLTGEDLVPQVGRVDIGQGVLVGVPSTEAEIDTSDESEGIVNDDEFLVMSLTSSLAPIHFWLLKGLSHPVQSHVSAIFEDVVVRMAQDLDVSVTRRSFRAETAQRVLRMGRIARQRLVDLLVHNHVDLHARLGAAFQHLIQSPFLGQERRSPQEQFGRQPPILDVNDLLSLLKRDGDSPQVVARIDIPLDAIVLADGREGAESVGFRDGGSLLVGFLLVLFVVAVVGVDDVEELAHLMLEVMSFFGDVGFCRGWLVAAVELRIVGLTFEVLFEGAELVSEFVHGGSQLICSLQIRMEQIEQPIDKNMPE